MSEPSQNNIVADAIKAGTLIGDPKPIAGTVGVVLPAGASIKTFEDLEESLREHPSKLKSQVQVEDADSFIAYFNRFADEFSTVFLDTDKQRFVGVLDYHNSPTAPRRANHLVIFTCPTNADWASWTSNSGTKMDQVELALFLEQHIENIQSPSGAQMLEIATSLKADRNVAFERSTRLADGQTQFVYHEVINGTAGVNKELVIPDEFTLGLQPIKGSEAYEVRCKFRWRMLGQGQISMWFDVIRPDRVRESAVNDVRAKIQAGMTQGMIVNGTFMNGRTT
jgi:uncharacterized protein YfdQ (DUF2303 family)